MRNVICACLLFLPVLGNAQTLRGDFYMSAYPKVAFVWNEYNPDIKDATQFILMADGIKTPLNLQRLTVADSSFNKPKTILFLWEDLNHPQHAGQSDFTRKALEQFFNETAIGKDDKFNVAVFDRKGGNDNGNSIHTMLSDDFTSDCNSLSEAVQNFKPKYDFFSKQTNSELYIAIDEGVKLLEKEPSDRVRAIVVFTAGSNQDSYGGRNTIDEARAIALKIPVYVVKYPIKGCEHCTNIDLICQATYGQEITTGDANAATQQLQEYYTGIPKRHHGQDYNISFTSTFPRDGKQHSVILSVGGKEYPLSFTAPSFSLKLWIKENILWTILIGVGFLIIIALIILLIWRNAKRRRQELLKLKGRQQTVQQEANANKRALESFRKQKEEEERRAKEQEQLQYFTKLMQTKNLCPRLQYSLNGKNVTYTINKTETTIGRGADNDIILPSDSISRHHARISFNGSSFEIQDLGSTNKVIVNGAFVQRVILSNSDIIGLGEIVIYFYG